MTKLFRNILIVDANNELPWKEIFTETQLERGTSLFVNRPSLKFKYPICVINYAFVEMLANHFHEYFTKIEKLEEIKLQLANVQVFDNPIKHGFLWIGEDVKTHLQHDFESISRMATDLEARSYVPHDGSNSKQRQRIFSPEEIVDVYKEAFVYLERTIKASSSQD